MKAVLKPSPCSWGRERAEKAGFLNILKKWELITTQFTSRVHLFSLGQLVNLSILWRSSYCFSLFFSRALLLGHTYPDTSNPFAAARFSPSRRLPLLFQLCHPCPLHLFSHQLWVATLVLPCLIFWYQCVTAKNVFCELPKSFSLGMSCTDDCGDKGLFQVLHFFSSDPGSCSGLCRAP